MVVLCDNCVVVDVWWLMCGGVCVVWWRCHGGCCNEKMNMKKNMCSSRGS